MQLQITLCNCKLLYAIARYNLNIMIHWWVIRLFPSDP